MRAVRSARLTIRLVRTVLLGSLLPALLAACSGSGSGAEPRATPTPPAAPVPSISLLAGDVGGQGNVDGPASLARFYGPGALTFDAANNLYIADMTNHLVRKLAADGSVTTLAGSRATKGTDDGPAAASTLSSPSGIAVDRTGNVFVYDFGNGTIRKITPSGVVSTLAGAPGVLGNADGAGPAARFGLCKWELASWCHVLPGLAIDNAGNLYAPDPGNHTIRKITPEGVVTTVAGVAGQGAYIDGPAGTARLHWPTGIALDAAGTLYITDNNAIRRIGKDGSVTTIAGADAPNDHRDGPALEARFYTPTALRFDAAGNLIVTERAGWVRKLAPDGTVSTVAGEGYSSTFPEQKLSSATGIAIDSSGTVFVSDAGNHVIRKLAADGSMPVVAGALRNRWLQNTDYNTEHAQNVRGLTVDKTGSAYFTALDFNQVPRQRIVKISPEGVDSTVQLKSELPAYAAPYLSAEEGGVLWGASGQDVFRLLPDGALNLFPLPYPNNIVNADGVTSDSLGNAYVSHLRGISKFDANGNGTIVAALTLGAHGIARDAAGNLYTALDCSNNNGRDFNPNTLVPLTGTNCSIIKITPTGSMTLVDGKQHPAKFTLPLHMALDQATGNLYVAENTLSSDRRQRSANITLNEPLLREFNQGFLVRKVTPQGEVSTVVGIPDARGFRPGPLPAPLPGPLSGIAISGRVLYIASGNAVLVVKDLL